MKKLPLVVDTVITLVSFALLALIAVSYLPGAAPTRIVFALVFALSGTYLTSAMHKHRSKPKVRKDRLDGIMNKFVFSPYEYAYGFVKDALASKGEVLECENLLKICGTAFAVRFSPQCITAADLAELYGKAVKANAKRLVILGSYGADEQAAATAKLLTSPAAEVWDFEKTYSLLCYLGHPPVESLKLETDKKRRKIRLGAVFGRKNFRKYLFTAIVTLIFARFTPYSVLYVAIAAAALVFAVLCAIDVTSVTEKKRK